MNLELISRIFYLEKEIERLETLETAVAVDGAGAITLIETVHLAAPAIALVFDNIPSTYTHLLFVGSVRSLRVTESDQCEVNFNNIALPNVAFDSFVNYCIGNPVSQGNNAQRITTGFMPGTPCPANMFGMFTMWVFFYKDIKRNRQIKSIAPYGKDKTAPDIEAVTSTTSGHWENTTDPVNRVDFASWTRGANMATGCHISLFGVH